MSAIRSRGSKDAIRTSVSVFLACFVTLGIFEVLDLRTTHRPVIEVILDEDSFEQALRNGQLKTQASTSVADFVLFDQALTDHELTSHGSASVLDSELADQVLRNYQAKTRASTDALTSVLFDQALQNHEPTTEASPNAVDYALFDQALRKYAPETQPYGSLLKDLSEQALRYNKSEDQPSNGKRTQAEELTWAPSDASAAHGFINSLTDTMADTEVTHKDLIPTVSREPTWLATYAAKREAFSTLYVGTLVYQPPKDMFMHEAQPFTLRIKQSTGMHSVIVLEQALPGDTTPVNRPVRVSDNGMQAHLFGAPDFQIDAQQNDGEVRVFPSDGMLEWSWNITPQHTGHHTLTLDVEALVDVDGHDRSLESVNKTTIDVRTNLRETVLSFVGDKIEWLWGILLVPVWTFAVPRINKAFKKSDTSTNLPSQNSDSLR